MTAPVPLEISLLGPVEVRVAGTLVPLAGQQIRTLVAVLALRTGEPVPMWRLIEALWTGEPPARARNQVQVYVSRIRKALLHAGCPDQVLRTRGEAYLLDLDRDRVDALRFTRLTTLAEERVAGGASDSVAGLLREALALWRSDPFADVTSGALRADAAALEDARCAARERWFDLELARGGHRFLVAQLRSAVAERPLHDGFRRRLMLALAGCGRHAEALDTYREGRRILHDELGLDPGTELQQLAQSILRGVVPGSELMPVPPLAAPRDPPAPAAVCSLPPAVAGFVGRALAKNVLRAGLGRSGSPPGMALVTGPGGIGKSTLGIRVAHELRDRYPDGQLFIDLLGSRAEPMAPREALGHLLRGFGVTGAVLPDDITERLMLYRSIAVERRVLIVLDDAAHEQQVRPLLPGAGGSAVLVTSRSRLVGLDDAIRVELGVLDRVESLRLLGNIAGEHRLVVQPAAADRIAALCGDHPLAVRIAAARLAERPHLRPERLADELSDERARLDALRAGDLEVRATLAVGYGGLDPAGRRAVRLLSLADLPHFPAWAAACVLDLPLVEAERLVETIVDTRLLEPVLDEPGGEVRYRFHELVRVFGRERAAIEEPATGRVEALQRCLAGYRTATERADAMLAAGILGVRRQPAELPPVPPVWIDAVRLDPAAWFTRELPALVALVRQAVATGEVRLAGALAAGMATFLETRNLYDHWVDTHTRVLSAARTANLRPIILAMLRNLGELHAIRDETAAAICCFTEALALARETGERAYEVASLAGLGYLHRLTGRYPLSIEAFTTAAAAARRDGNRNGGIFAEQGVGAVWFEQGRLAEAAVRFTDCAHHSRVAGYRAGEAQALRGLGLVHLVRGEPARAAMLFRRARRISAALGDQLVEAYATQLLGDAYARSGRYGRAESLLRSADRVFARFGSRFGRAMVLVSLARARIGRRRLVPARVLLEQAGPIWGRLGMPYWGGQAFDLLAEVCRRTGDAVGADRAVRQAQLLRYGGITADAAD
ncbi:BTAD domain-containing putative transcriptional regulator [Micromonospora polyrhachis]|uniref:DNA-binding SARP family transcriptional activator/tetratricopeptide (TPR) repeat protein n=1 Tax=Micromonospora polyrhachis TaxID=1282883 RepID=A0A7W7WS46_9ACTN|nr:BTAD domain-containing putative transcriptional regulator [Micromonospora polyrhachis]MBB4961609.1 DNA-binding SARP family transcriptional activator/tetratricopeptide (TPR) repeat protein [Micromonospora polyrhachis]